MGLIRHLCVTYTVLLIIKHTEQVDENTNDEFNRLAQEQHSVCSTHYSCLEQNITESFGSSCCGSCTCYPDCSKYGSCCLAGYESLAGARASIENTRYGCVSAQNDSTDNTKYITDRAFRMISKCDPSYPDNAYKRLCELPRHEQSLKSFIPVTEMTRNMTTYRNIYCAYCNNIASMVHLIRWPIVIHSERRINTSTPNLNELKKDGVYVIFEQPAYLNIDKCMKNGPSYYISSCNETGLWSVYNRSIAQACGSYIDPFNDTFKNYFCYLCNSVEPQPIDQWECKQIPALVSHMIAFTVTLDTSLLADDHNRRWLLCDKTQIPDYIMMVCRHVRCYGDRVLNNGKCVNYGPVRLSSDDEHCFSAFLKATPSNELRFPKDELVPLVDTILRLAQLNSQIWSTTINFFQTETGESYKYILIYILVKFDQNINRIRYESFFQNILSLKSHKVSINKGGIGQVAVEFKQYNITFSDGMATVTVPNQTAASFDVLTAPYWPVNLHYCLEKEVLMINKIYVCPFLELHINDYSIRIENTFLYFNMDKISNEPFKVLQNWEYEIHGDKVYICLEDFLDVYEAVVKLNSKPQSSTMTRPLESHVLLLMFTFFSKIALRWYL